MNLHSLIPRSTSTSQISQLLRNQLLWMLLLRVILYTLLLIISYIFQDRGFAIIVVPPRLLLIFILIIYVSTIISALFLLVYEGDMRRYGFIQTLLDTFFVSILVYFSGASNSTFSTVYFFPIIAGGLILPRKGGLVAAAAGSLQYAAILALELNGFYPSYLLDYLIFDPVSTMASLNQFAIHGLIFFLAALLSALFGLRLQKTESALSDSIKQFDRLSILYKQVFDNISTGILTINGEQLITSANNAIFSITGLLPETLVGKKLKTVFPNIDLSKENFRLTTDFQREDGKEVRIGYAHMTIERTEDDPDNSDSHKIITLRDISEIEKLERQVRQTEKLAAIGMMSASIAHDFRNPLTAISGSAQVLSDEFSKGGATNHVNFELASIILRESNRLNTTIGEFLKFSRPEHVNCEWFTLKGCLDEVLQVLKAGSLFPQKIEFTFDFEITTDIWGDPKQMFVVLSHLIQNATAFCPKDEERIHISSFEVHNEDGGEYLRISIADNGTGIQASDPDQIFEPFYTKRADGTGLGLAIVNQIIEEHRGTIHADNSGLENQHGGFGAQFLIHLPIPDGAPYGEDDGEPNEAQIN